MVILGKRGLEWMDPLLQTPIYEVKRKCQVHNPKYENVFCSECMGQPFCETCWKNSEHVDHQVVQVYASSRRTAINIVEIEKLWDASGIQRYVSNEKQVVFLNPHKESGSKLKKQIQDRKPTEEQNNSFKCETCNRKLLDSKYNFCSIACKKTRTESETMSLGIKKTRTETTTCMSSFTIIKKIGTKSTSFTIKKTRINSISLRKKNRKGIPRRAPLY